ncbi:MAG: hypothetical protein R6U95_05280 [Bacteroidales bacterium]
MKKSLIYLISGMFVPFLMFSQSDNSSDKVSSTFMSAGEKRAKIIFQGGYYMSNNAYNDIKAGENLSLDFLYMLTGKWSLGQHMSFGKNRYYETQRTNMPLYNLDSDNTNADVYTVQVGLNVGYTYPLSRLLSVSAFSGISTYFETIMYPVMGDYLRTDDIWVGYKQETQTVCAVPFLASIQYIANDFLEIGVKGGIYVSPKDDVSVLGAHFGPELIFKL